MKLEEVLPALREGKRVRAPGRMATTWNQQELLDFGFPVVDLFAEGWRIVEPPSQKQEITKADIIRVISDHPAINHFGDERIQAFAEDVCSGLGFRSEKNG